MRIAKDLPLAVGVSCLSHPRLERELCGIMARLKAKLIDAGQNGPYSELKQHSAAPGYYRRI